MKFFRGMPKPFPLPAPIRWRAVDGHGDGAHGCYQSHLTLLRHAIEQKHESYCVFEDDACFVHNFAEKLDEFFAELPDDWEMAYLGGQLIGQAEKITDRVYKPWDVQRTHALCVHSRGYAKLLAHLEDPNHAAHIDHHLARAFRPGAIRVYCPRRWMVGQDVGVSDIEWGRNHDYARFYNHAASEIPSVKELAGVPVIEVVDPQRVLAGAMQHLGCVVGTDASIAGVNSLRLLSIRTGKPACLISKEVTGRHTLVCIGSGGEGVSIDPDGDLRSQLEYLCEVTHLKASSQRLRLAERSLRMELERV